MNIYSELISLVAFMLESMMGIKAKAAMEMAKATISIFKESEKAVADADKEETKKMAMYLNSVCDSGHRHPSNRADRRKLNAKKMNQRKTVAKSQGYECPYSVWKITELIARNRSSEITPEMLEEARVDLKRENRFYKKSNDGYSDMVGTRHHRFYGEPDRYLEHKYGEIPETDSDYKIKKYKNKSNMEILYGDIFDEETELFGYTFEVWNEENSRFVKYYKFDENTRFFTLSRKQNGGRIIKIITKEEYLAEFKRYYEKKLKELNAGLEYEVQSICNISEVGVVQPTEMGRLLNEIRKEVM